MTIKSKAVQFTRAEAEALMNMMQHCGITSCDAVRPYEVAALKNVHESLPIAARTRIVLSLNDKIWSAWADTHPEEGPFK